MFYNRENNEEHTVHAVRVVHVETLYTYIHRESGEKVFGCLGGIRWITCLVKVLVVYVMFSKYSYFLINVKTMSNRGF